MSMSLKYELSVGRFGLARMLPAFRFHAPRNPKACLFSTARWRHPSLSSPIGVRTVCSRPMSARTARNASRLQVCRSPKPQQTRVDRRNTKHRSRNTKYNADHEIRNTIRNTIHTDHGMRNTIRNTEHATRNPKSEIPVTEHEIRNPKHETRNRAEVVGLVHHFHSGL